ncbi:MAG: type II toxin-antitoxin system Phd/YefM family antitoxin [Acidimicrobiales bacterium]
MTTMTISEARARLAEVLHHVEKGGEVTITRHGRPVAIVVRPDSLRVRRAGKALGTAEQIRAALAAGRGSILSQVAGVTAHRADELVSAVRAGRDAHS